MATPTPRSPQCEEKRGAWREDLRAAPTYLKCTAVASLIVGVLALAGFVVVDYLCGWGGSAYLPSVLSTFTGALFSVPFALFVLNALIKDQADRSEQRTVLRLARGAAGDFHQTVQGCVQLPTAADREAVVLALVSKADEFYTEAVTKTHELRSRPRGGDFVHRSPSRRAWDPAAAAAKAFETYAAEATELATSRGAEAWAGKVEAQWHYLERDLRARLIAADCAWLELDLAQTIRADIDVLTGPDARCLRKTRRLIQNMPATGSPILRYLGDLAECARQARTWTHALERLMESSRRPVDAWAEH